jgi:hypothetical protein
MLKRINCNPVTVAPWNVSPSRVLNFVRRLSAGDGIGEAARLDYLPWATDKWDEMFHSTSTSRNALPAER